MPSTTTYDLRMTQLNNRNDFPLVFMSTIYSLVDTASQYLKPERKRVWNIASSVCVCSFTRTYITCTSTNYVDVPANSCITTLEAGDAATRNADVWHLLVLVIRVRLLHLSMYVRTCHRNSIKQMHYYLYCCDIYRGTVGVNVASKYFYLFWYKILRQFGNNFVPRFISINLSIHQDPTTPRKTGG